MEINIAISLELIALGIGSFLILHFKKESKSYTFSQIIGYLIICISSLNFGNTLFHILPCSHRDTCSYDHLSMPLDNQAVLPGNPPQDQEVSPQVPLDNSQTKKTMDDTGEKSKN